MEVADFPEMMIDGKYRQSHSHHTLLALVEKKYCLQDGQVPVLVTKHARQRGFNVTLPGWYFANMLELVRAARRVVNRVEEKVEELESEVQK